MQKLNISLAVAVEFSKKWENASMEEKESPYFVEDFLGVLGIQFVPVEHREYKVYKDGVCRKMDFFVKEKIAIEMKSKGEDLNKAFEQLEGYVQCLPKELVPKILMVCDFENIILDIDKKKYEFKTKVLRKHLHLFNCLFEKDENIYNEQIEVNVKASEKMAKLHDALEAHGYTGHNLEVYLVRLLFCLFAEDTEIFLKRSFFKYVNNSKNASDLSFKIEQLFEVLNTSDEDRKKKEYLLPELLNFRYINGGLFYETLPLAIDEKIRNTIIECADFDWSNISPAIFGAMFQGVMDKKKRRELGAHYTSEENIMKLIKPLFLDALYEEFEYVKNIPKKLDEFHTKIASLKFLDPACGCGNFLIIAYRELRKLETKILEKKIIKSGKIPDYSNDSNTNASSKIVLLKQGVIDIKLLLRVNVEQFYGIEYEEFPCEIAKVGMWLTDHQMNTELDKLGQYFVRLPLTKGATIIHGNALRLDWESIVPKGELSYILGNPPFVGNNNLSASQREDLAPFFPKNKTMDYVTAWYVKATDYIHDTKIRCAFVSTNSISQGEQVALLWKPLIKKGICINFGEPTFKWSNEAKGKAAVHCVIVGFSYQKTTPNINPYLFEGPTIFIESRAKPICDVPEIQKGNQPTDGGNLIIEADEFDDFIKKEPLVKPYIRRLVGSQEYINNLKRYCLWLVDIPPDILRKMPLVLERVKKVREMRLASPDNGTQKLAGKPTLFRETHNPETFIIVPSVSSEKREYIPIGFMNKDTIATNLVLIIPNATLYHFGILTSNVHNAWMRAICGRLEMRYRYSKDIVYNNFPWPEATKEQKAEIGKLAQEVLNARAKFPKSSLADLYDPLAMPPELLKAHKALDGAVARLYGFGRDVGEAEVVAALMGRYEKYTNG